MRANQKKFEISLSKGEMRVVYLTQHSVIFAAKGTTILVEQVSGLGEASFGLYILLRQGDIHFITYGGQVVLEAEQCAQLDVILPKPWGQSWRDGLTWCLKAMQRGSRAVGRRMQDA